MVNITVQTKRLLTVALFLVILLPWTALATTETTAPSTAEYGTPEQRYNEAKFYYNQLENSDSLSKDRDNWLKGVRNFTRIYLAEPTSKYAPLCLFMLGKLQHLMYLRFDTKDDLKEAIDYYEDTARLFPEHVLADDAYYAIGLIYLRDLKDPKNSAHYLAQIVNNYPSGDMHPKAADLLQQLTRDYDIPLPGTMVGNAQINRLSYVLPVKYWSSANYTRIVIMASSPVKYKEQLLKETASQPRRLYIDFHSSYIEPQYRAPIPIKNGLLQQIRTGQFSKDTVRVVLDIESIDSYEIYSLPDPFRVVIDVRGKASQQQTPSSSGPKLVPPKPGAPQTDPPPRLLSTTVKKKRIIVLKDHKKIKKGSLQQSTRQEIEVDSIEVEESTPSKKLSLAQQLGLGIKRIVLDPGHGGKDPGAIGHGLKEKDIVLDLAKRLQPVLADNLGCEVILTRETDTFISLEERTAIANTKGADLFISLHVNAHPSSKVRGIETYYLNLSTNAEAMRVAAMENATSTHQMSDLQDILSDIMKNSKIKESSRLATQVQQAIMEGLNTNQFGKIKNLGVKQAPFYVLIGAQMPAILLEVSFVSNPKDAQNLRSPEFLDILAQQILMGIKSYINTDTAAVYQVPSNS